MDEKTNKGHEREYLTEKEARAVRELFQKHLQDYKQKPESMSDEEWLKNLFASELPEMSPDEAAENAKDVVTAIHTFDEHLESVNEAEKHGISKERWLADTLQKAASSMAMQEYGQALQTMDDALYANNMELEKALQRSQDGHIKMSPNLDGNIAEQMIAQTTELSGVLQDKNIKVEVRNAYTKNSVDVRATNLDTGEYQNYQLKFGKDAKATIDLIEKGNYNNQRIIVPAEQLEEVQAHFKAKGSSKTISDHIEAWGAEGKKFTKSQVKELQLSAQEDGIMPSMDYNQYQTKDLAMSIGKNAGAMALQSAAVTTGLTIAQKLFKGEKVDPDEMVEIALKTGADTSVKVVSAGTLQVAIRKGIVSFIPELTPAGVIANIACVGIENIKILWKIASKEMSIEDGLDRMGRVTTSMAGGLAGMIKGTEYGAALGIKLASIPVIGAPLAVASSFIGGMVGYFGGSKIGDAIYSAGKKVARAAKNVAKVAVEGIKSAGRAIGNEIKRIGRGIRNLFSLW